MDIVTGLKVIKERLDDYDLGYYEYCEILRYVLVYVVTEKEHDITEEFIHLACNEGLHFLKTYATGR